MNEKTFPFRLDDRTREFLSGFLALLHGSNARFSATSGAINLQFLEKGAGSKTVDGRVSFVPEGVRIVFSMNGLAKADPEVSDWLRRYHGHLQSVKKSTLIPVPQRCSVMVEARFDGSLRYHLTYIVSYPDESLAQDTPQTLLYVTEGLFAKPAALAEQAWQHAEPPAPPKLDAPAKMAEQAELAEPAERQTRIRMRKAIGL